MGRKYLKYIELRELVAESKTHSLNYKKLLANRQKASIDKFLLDNKHLQ
jgi:hypothetical protein